MATNQKMNATVETVMTADPITIKPTAKLAEAARLMQQHDIGNVLVCDNKTLNGIITDRDIVVRGVALGADLAGLTVADCCSPATFTTTRDASIDAVASMMRDNAIRRLPVVDGDELIGVVSLGDVSQADQAKDVGSTLAGISAAPPSNAERR